MSKIKNLKDVAFRLELYDATIGNIVDKLINLGHTDKVNTYHDDVLGLDRNIPDELKRMHIDDVIDDENIQEQFENEIQDIIWNAQVIFEILDKEETEEMREEIAENIYSQTGRYSRDD